MNATEFLAELFTPEPPGYVCTWTLRTKRSSYWPLTNNLVGVDQQRDVFYGVGLSHIRRPAGQRTPANQVCGIAGTWLDLDIAADGRAMRSLDDALAVAAAHLKPTLIVASGSGLHAYHLLTGGPWRFTSREEQQHAMLLAAQWQQLHRRKAQELGGGLDHTHDLARVLRLPGTLNTKTTPARPVRVLDTSGPRHTLRDLEELCRTAGPVALTGGAAGTDPGTAVNPADRVDDTTTQQITALIENDEDFADAWHHRATGHRRAGWSMSEWEMSLVARAAPVMTDRELAQLITAHRLFHDPADRKHLRQDYVTRTIHRARRERTPALRSAA